MNSDNAPTPFETTMKAACRELKGLPWQTEARKTAELLTASLSHPCIVAVSGEVSAGKSTFINAFLGADIAVTGATATTATLTYYRYGAGEKHKTAICHWENGTQTQEDLEFITSLQGDDPETLKRSGAVQYIEVFFDHPNLQFVTIADTPGTESMIESHQEKADIIANRNYKKTEEVTQNADAVIYMTGFVPGKKAGNFIAGFNESGSGKANPMNAVGVMAKIDKNWNILQNRYDFCNDISQAIPAFNTVAPISALLQEAADKLQKGSRIEPLWTLVRNLPEPAFEELFMAAENFEEMDAEDLAEIADGLSEADVELTLKMIPSLNERRHLSQGIDWSVFQTACRLFRQEPSPDKALESLYLHSGVDAFRKVLDQHFFQRSKLLKAYRVMSDFHCYLDNLRKKRIYESKDEIAEKHRKGQRFLELLNHVPNSEPALFELIAFINDHFPATADTAPFKEQITKAIVHVEGALDELEACNADFNALNLLQGHRDFFTDAEINELECVLGRFGLEIEARLRHLEQADRNALEDRMLHWQGQSMFTTKDKTFIIEQVKVRYARMYTQLFN
nr:dynamin family protein [uncultured Desulfobacter sp.]